MVRDDHDDRPARAGMEGTGGDGTGGRNGRRRRIVVTRSEPSFAPPSVPEGMAQDPPYHRPDEAPASPAARRAAERREAEEVARAIVPPQAVAGRALVSVVAIMGFLVSLAVGGLSLVSEAARDWQLDISREVTIQIEPLDTMPLEPRLAKALEIARETRGVTSARLVDARESADLLEPWLGRGLDLSALPVPRLVVLALDDPASADLAGLSQRIGAEVAGAIVDDHAVWAERLRAMAGTAVVAGVAVVVLMLAAMVLSVVFATRAAMAGNRNVIEVLHFVGAEDRFIARQFQHHFLVLGLQGGTIGGAAAIVVFLLADWVTRAGRGEAMVDQVNALFGGVSVGLGGYAGVVGVVAVVALLTAVTSRITVLGHLGDLE